MNQNKKNLRADVSKNQVIEEKAEREAMRKRDLQRPLEDVVAETNSIVEKMSAREQKSYQRLLRYVFRKHCPRTVYVAIDPNRAAQIDLKPEDGIDSECYEVADVKNIIASATISGQAVVLLRYVDHNELGIGMLGGVAINRHAVLKVADARSLQTAWRSFISTETFSCDSNLKCIQPAV